MMDTTAKAALNKLTKEACLQDREGEDVCDCAAHRWRAIIIAALMQPVSTTVGESMRNDIEVLGQAIAEHKREAIQVVVTPPHLKSCPKYRRVGQDHVSIAAQCTCGTMVADLSHFVEVVPFNLDDLTKPFGTPIEDFTLQGRWNPLVTSPDDLIKSMKSGDTCKLTARDGYEITLVVQAKAES